MRLCSPKSNKLTLHFACGPLGNEKVANMGLALLLILGV